MRAKYYLYTWRHKCCQRAKAEGNMSVLLDFLSVRAIYIWKNINKLITITYKRRNEVKNVGRHTPEFSWFRFLLWWSVGWLGVGSWWGEGWQQWRLGASLFWPGTSLCTFSHDSKTLNVLHLCVSFKRLEEKFHHMKKLSSQFHLKISKIFVENMTEVSTWLEHHLSLRHFSSPLTLPFHPCTWISLAWQNFGPLARCILCVFQDRWTILCVTFPSSSHKTHLVS